MVKIDQIIEQNRWWALGSGFSSYDSDLRKFEQAYFKITRRPLELEKGKALIIFGPRQVGKTTLIKQTIQKLISKNIDPKSIAYFSCNVLTGRTRRELQIVIRYLLDKLKSKETGYLFLDEISIVKGWSEEIQYFFDQGKFNNLCLCLTGSPLGIKETLPGRPTKEYFMEPVSFRDFVENLTHNHNRNEAVNSAFDLDSPLRQELNSLTESHLSKLSFEFTNLQNFKGLVKQVENFHLLLKHLFEIYLHTGGFPSVLNKYLNYHYAKKTKPDEEIDKSKAIFEEEYKMIIDQLIDALKKRGKSELIAKQILYAVAEKLSSRYSLGRIGQETEEELSKATVLEYLQHLQDIFFIKIVYAYNLEKQTPAWKKNKKIYLIDPFILYSIKKFLTGKEGIEITEGILNKEEETSLIIENLAALHLIHTKEEPFIKPPDTFVWFWYSAQKEIDFIYQGESLFGLEVKYKRKKEKQFTLSQIKEYIIITQEDLEFQENLVYLPAHLFFFLIKKGKKQI